MIDRQRLRDYLQWFLIPTLHWTFVETAAEAISLVVAGKPGEPVTTPEGETLSASEVVAEWSLEDFVQAEREERSAPPKPSGDSIDLGPPF